MIPWTYQGSCMCVSKSFNCGWLCATLWAAACQAPLSMGFSRQEYLSGLPCRTPGDPSELGIEPESLTYPALASRFFTTSTTWEPKVLSLPQAHLTIPYFLVLLSSSFQPRSLMQYCLPARSLVPQPEQVSPGTTLFVTWECHTLSLRTVAASLLTLWPSYFTSSYYLAHSRWTRNDPWLQFKFLISASKAACQLVRDTGIRYVKISPILQGSALLGASD